MRAIARPRLKRQQLPAGECLCDYCTAKCCRYFAMPMEEPETFEEFEYVRWFLLHDRASVFKEDGDWYLLYSDLIRSTTERRTPNKLFER